MKIFSRVLLVALAGAMIAGCGSNPHRAGKGNDHEVVYRGYNADDRDDDQRVVYVQRPAPTYVYYEPAPAYVVPARPTYRVVPVTRYYYVD